jgi:hypothetical protein
VDTRLTAADGHAERIAALSMIEPRPDRPRAITSGADKAYKAEDFVNELKSMNVRAHVAQNDIGRRSAHHPARQLRHEPENPQAHRRRLRLDQDRGRSAQDPVQGQDQVGWAFTFAAAAYSLVRLPKLLEVPA